VPLAVPPSLPATVVALAQTVYDGTDAVFALRDSLLECGLTEFAQRDHPRGCAWLDAILRK